MKRAFIAVVLIGLAGHVGAHHGAAGVIAGARKKTVRVEGRIVKVFPPRKLASGERHQHLIIDVARVESGAGPAPGSRVFVAIRYGDREGLRAPIAFDAKVRSIELQGEFVDRAHATKGEDNPDRLPVIHFTHHPVGWVRYGGRVYR